MGQHYFLVASLPTLHYDMRDPMEPTQFLELCETQLSAEELERVRSATIDAPGSESSWGIVENWHRFERGLRNALVKQRAPQRGVEAATYIRRDERGDDNSNENGVLELARSAAAHETPLGAEDELNHARWAYLEDLEAGYFFELERLIIYYIKLQIVARHGQFRRKHGEQQFHAIIETIMGDYYSESGEQQ